MYTLTLPEHDRIEKRISRHILPRNNDPPLVDQASNFVAEVRWGLAEISDLSQLNNGHRGAAPEENRGLILENNPNAKAMDVFVEQVRH